MFLLPPSEGSVSALLYVGLGLVAVGMVITFVGLGEKGFKSFQLRLVGPGLVGLGVLLRWLLLLTFLLLLTITSAALVPSMNTPTSSTNHLAAPTPHHTWPRQ